MTELLKQLTPDELALVACVAAIVSCAAIMSLSYYIGPARQAARQAAPVTPQTVPSRRSAPARERAA